MECLKARPNNALYREVPIEVEVHNSDVTATAQKVTTKRSEFVGDFLKRHAPASRMTELLDEDLRHKQFFLDNKPKARKHFDHRPGKQNHLSCAEKHRLKVFDIDPKKQRYSMFLPLHRLWKDYINDLIPTSRLKAENKSNVEQQLIRADYHGALISVTRATNPALIGVTGIVIQETRNVFRVISHDDRVKTIPKQNTVLSVQHSGFIFTIYGNQFRVRASDRVTRKFKTKPTIDL